MYFLDLLLAEIYGLLKLDLADGETSGKIATTFKENLYVHVQKAILSGEYYHEDAVDKINEILKAIRTLELQIGSFCVNQELEEFLKELSDLEEQTSQDDPLTEPFTLLKQTAPATSESPALNFPHDPSDPAENISTKNPAGPYTIPETSVYFDVEKWVKKFTDKNIQKLKDLAESVKKNLDYLSSGRDGEIADTKLLKNYKLKSELVYTLGVENLFFDILTDSLFELNILLAYMDEYLECNVEMLSELRSINGYLKDSFQNLQNNEIFTLIKHKAAFLEFKIMWRNCHKSNAHYPPIHSDNPYKSFELTLTRHYSQLKEADATELHSIIANYTPENQDHIALENFHHLNRYYRRTLDDTAEYKKEVIDDLIQKLTDLGGLEHTKLFDKIAHKSIYNLLKNSQIFFSLNIEHNNNYQTIINELIKSAPAEKGMPSSAFLTAKFSEIREHINTRSLSDYYCHKILFDFIMKFTWDLQSNPAMIMTPMKEDDEEKINAKKAIALKIVSVLQALAQKALKEYKFSLRRMMTHEVKPAYLTFKECLVTHNWQDGHEGHLFIDSSYILPNDFEKLKSEIASAEAVLNSQFDIIRNAIEMKASQLIIDFKSNNFEKKVKDNEFKLVQIIAMFVSIATFVLINVKIFDNKTGLESFAIILGLAACFILFNSFFYFIIMAQIEKSKIPWHKWAKVLSFIILPALLCAGSYFLLSREGEKTHREIKALHEKIKTDSIQNQLRYDHLNK